MSTTKPPDQTQAGQSSHVDRLLQKIQAIRDERPEPWLPTPGEIIYGHLVRYGHADGEYGRRDYAIIADEEHDGRHRCVWLTTNIIRSEFRRWRPRPGERLAIKRLKDREGRRGTCKVFHVEMDREPAEDVPTFDGQADSRNTEHESTSHTPQREVDDDVPF